MLDRYELIKKTPTEALVSILNHNFDLQLTSAGVVFEDMTALDGRRTQLACRALDTPGLAQKYTGKGSFIFHRLYLSDIFDVSTLSVQISLPATTNGIIEKLKEIHPFEIDTNDFVLENILAGTSSYLLRAKSESLRWLGSMTIPITALDPELNFDVIYLNGLIDPDLPIYMDSLVTNDVLDGLDDDFEGEEE